MLKRKKELFSKFSERDKISRLGTMHHYVSDKDLQEWYEKQKSKTTYQVSEDNIKTLINL